MRIHDLAGIHLPVGIPNGFELAECLNNFLSEHFRKQLGSGLAVTVFTGKGAPIAHNEIRCFFGEASVMPNTFLGNQVKSNAAMNTPHTEVAVQGSNIAVFLEKLAEVAQIRAHFVWRDG